MIFNSLAYALFLPLVVLAYWQMGQRGRLWLLLAASYWFYGTWDWRFLTLIWISTIVDFLVGRAISKTDDEKRRRWLFVTSLVVNLSLLGFFKYFGFFVDSAEQLLSSVGLDVSAPTLEILLPVGISFYTFQTISYTFDIYRRRLEPTNDLLLFAVFVAFFPQLVAGPIERARDLLPQLEKLPLHPDRARVWRGLHLLLLGLVKKVVIADVLAPHVAEAFDNAGTIGWSTATVAMFAFAIQVYGDGSGYTDIARGSAKLLGVDLVYNYREPYLSRNIGEFWRRWHISLSQWLRDYLYIPMGGSKGSEFATYRNLFLTMTLTGLWHGAAVTFVVFGAIHGVKMSIERMRGNRVRDDDPLGLRDLGPVLFTFIFHSLTLILFRAASMGEAGDMFSAIFQLRPGPLDVEALAALLVLGSLMFGIDAWTRWRPGGISIARLSPAARGLAYGLAVSGLVVATGASTEPFYYFRF